MTQFSEDELLQQLSRAVDRFDSPPPDVLHAARAAFALRALDAELAVLVRDTATEPELAGVRGEVPPRLLLFRWGEVSMELELTQSQGRRRVLGQVLGRSRVGVLIDASSGATRLDVDDAGRFCGPVPDSPFRIRLTSPDGDLVSNWVMA